MSETNSVAYQNKDITSKYFGEHLKDKSLAVYGLKIPKIAAVLPTNLPLIEANELRIDNLFRLEDGSLALIDYESTYADESKLKYLNYVIRTLKRSLDKEGLMRNIRMIVIYTADIEPGMTRPRMDVGCLQFELEEAFLVNLDSKAMEADLRRKIKMGERLTDEDMMKFVILPLTYRGKKKKQSCIRRCFDMAKQITDVHIQVFMLSGMLVFADKVVTKEDSENIKEWLRMTQVGQLFEEEKIAYGKEQCEMAKWEKEEEIARKMLARGDSVAKVVSIMSILTKEEVQKLAAKKK